jgi:hypothetical protein
MGEHFGLIAPGYCAPLVYVTLEGDERNEALSTAISQGGGAAQLVMID